VVGAFTVEHGGLMSGDLPAWSDTSGLGPTDKIDTTVSHSARIWNYWLGGKDNYAVDRELGDQIAERFPQIVAHARISRLFLGRAVRYLAMDMGIRQFLDIGTGLPVVDNTHEVAQRIAPDARIVYVDNDPLVLVHARALLTSTPEGNTDYLEADLYDPDTILAGAQATLDFGRPVAITLLGVLWHVLDDDVAKGIINRLVRDLAPGSHLAIAHPTIEVTGEKMAEAIQEWNRFGTPKGRYRTPAEISELFAGLELVDPGIVSAPKWRPEALPFGKPEDVDLYCGVGRKP
jgi:S-adenosyl methyltransferase